MNGKKVLVTGSQGMLGSSLIKLLQFEEMVGCGSASFDITDSQKTNEFLNLQKPDIIIHTAAYTNVEDCEVNPDKAYRINTIGTQNLVNYCIDKDVLFVYISSTGLYGNKKEKERYSEFDSVFPTTIHHKSKYEAEKTIQNHLSKFLILRTGWLFGGDKEHAKNFVYKRFLEAVNSDTIYADNSQIGNPTYTADFVEQIKVLIDNKQYGLFNCVNEAANISRYDYVKKIVEFFDLKCSVKVAPEGMFARVAPVSHNESAVNCKLNLLGLNVMNDWERSLDIYVQQMKSEI